MSGPVHPHVYFPVEITSRELAGHLLLGTRLASSGMSVIVGHNGPVKRLIHEAPTNGIVFYKGDAGRSDYFRRPDFAYVGQDPELGFVFRHYRDFAARRIGHQRLETSSAYFAFGRQDYSFLSKTFPDIAPKLHLTGSARTMLWSSHGNNFYSSDVERIQSRFGEFCLAVSSGARGNPKQRVQHPDRVAWLNRNAKNLLQRAQFVREATGLAVVIRPHPAESYTEWKRAVNAIPGLHVEVAYDLNAWIRASRFMIQSPSSSAAFEAWLADTPSIAVGAPEPHLARDGSRSDIVSDKLCVSSSIWAKQFCLEDVFSKYVELKQSAAPNVLVAERIHRPSNDATLPIAEILWSLTGDLGAQKPKASARLVMLEKLERHSYRRILEQERLGRFNPPPFKRWALSQRRIDAGVRRSARILGVEPNVRVKQVLPNCFLLTKAY